MKKENKFFREPSSIRSIDATYTKKPPNTVSTFSPVGSGTQRANVKKHSYTNTIVTMISGDGDNHTPCLMFTCDPWMDKENKKRKHREELAAALNAYNISQDRIYYTKSTKHMLAESSEMYEKFLAHYTKLKKIPEDTLILHDGGNAFKRGKTSIFPKLGFKDHVTYPADVHQFLSPNDNKLHGCKAVWKDEYYKFESRVWASIRLMNLIDLDTLQHSKRYFEANLFHVKRSDLDEVIGLRNLGFSRQFF